MTRPPAMPNDSKPALVPKLRFPEFRDGTSWESDLLGNLAEMRSGGTPLSSVPEFYGGDIPWVSIADMTKAGKYITSTGRNLSRAGLENCAAEVFPIGTVIFAMYASIGECGIAKVPLCSSQAILGIRPSGHLSNEFLYYYLSLLKPHLKSLGQHGTQANLNKGIVQNLRVPLPRPAEQQKIAECLSTLDELIGAESQKLDALKAHKKGLMQQLFPREGEPLPRLRFPEFRDAPEWQEVFLGDYFDPIRNGFVGTATPYYVTRGGVKYLQGRNIKEGRIEDENLVLISQEFHTRQRKSHLKIGDLLMVQSGHVGECAVVNSVFAGANCHALIILTPKRTLSSAFFVYYFYSPIGKRALFQITTGNTIKHILASELKTLKVMLPSTDEQHRIATCLSSLDDLIAAQSERISALQTHKQGLLQQIFPSTADIVRT